MIISKILIIIYIYSFIKNCNFIDFNNKIVFLIFIRINKFDIKN